MSLFGKLAYFGFLRLAGRFSCLLVLFLSSAMMTSALMAQQRELNYVAADSASISEHTCFVFDSTGRFEGRIEMPDYFRCVLIRKKDGSGSVMARFADPEHDPFLIDSTTRITFVDRRYIRSLLKKAGAKRGLAHGILLGSFFLAARSGYGGRLDFAGNTEYGIEDCVFYVTHSRKDGYVVHNKFNFGNFMWGASAKSMGVPGFLARWGSHFNNFFLSPDTKWTLDSKDDIFSIKHGYRSGQ